MNRRLLFITHHKLDDNNGGANASKGFLLCFARLFDDCTLICHTMDTTSPSFIPPNVRYLPMQDSRTKLRKLFDMYRGAISGHYYFVRQHLRHNRYDVVVVDHTFTGAGLSAFIKSTGASLITIHHNVERDYLRDNSREKPLLYRYPFLYYCRKAERDCLRHSDINLTVTRHDARTFRSWAPDACICHWGIFEYRPIAEKTFPASTRGQTFIITGSLNFEQSLRPVMAFLRRYWPLVLQAMPGARLLIAGRNPSALLQAACEATHGVSLIANPADMQAVVSTADYYVCPIHAGSGLKLRIFDGLKAGLPVLCHQVAAAGYEALAAKGCLFSYTDEHSFSLALHQLTLADIAPQTVYQTFRDTFSMAAGLSRLSAILQQAHLL